MMRKEWKGALIGGITGILLSILFNIRGDLLYSPENYSYTFNLFALLTYPLLGFIFGVIYAHKKKIILTTILLSLFFGVLLFFNTKIWNSFTLGSIILGRLNPSFVISTIKSEVVLLGFVFLLIWWAVIGFMLGFVIKKIIQSKK